MKELVGIVASIPVTKSLSLQSEVMYSGKGYGFKINDNRMEKVSIIFFCQF